MATETTMQDLICKALKKRPIKGFTASELSEWFWDRDMCVNYDSLRSLLSRLYDRGVIDRESVRESGITGYKSYVYTMPTAA